MDKKIYTLKELIKKFGEDVISKAFLNIYTIDYVQTNFKVAEPIFVIPKQCRTYNTGLYFYNNKYVAYDDLKVLPDFKGTAYYKKVLIREVWEEYDNRNEYILYGYNIVLEEEFNNKQIILCGGINSYE